MKPNSGPPILANTVARLGLVPWVRLRGGTLQVLVPEWFYDLCVLVFFPL